MKDSSDEDWFAAIRCLTLVIWKSLLLIVFRFVLKVWFADIEGERGIDKEPEIFFVFSCDSF